MFVVDDFGGKGLGLWLMEGIIDVVCEKGLVDIEGLVLMNNFDMFKLMCGLGFLVKFFFEEFDFCFVL